MLPIELQPEPADFDKNVREPGFNFLKTNPHPTSKEWRNKEYWQSALPNMRLAYKRICAYSSCWIPYSTGSHSIDHFVPKSKSPKLAYEWNNFRYVSTRFNSRKARRVIVDPFEMKKHWFVIDFTKMFINPNKSELNQTEIVLAKNTIRYLRLNDDDELVLERIEFYKRYKSGDISFQHLKNQVPFLAYEMQRQNLL